MSREQLPYMSDEQFNRVAFVYRSKTDGVRVVGLTESKNYEDKTKWEHLATLNTLRWIQGLLISNSKEQRLKIKEILK